MKAFPYHDKALSFMQGMDLRDWFAGLAMQGLLEHIDIRHEISQNGVATRAYEMADAMMKARDDNNE